jgi:hypothetical protein
MRAGLFSLSGRSPTPFNVATAIHLQISSAGLAVLHVYDAQGQLLRRACICIA